MVLMFIVTVNAQWIKTNGPTGATIYTLAASGTNLFAGEYGKIFLSTDRGTSWGNITPNIFYLTEYRYLFINQTGVYVGTGGSGVFFQKTMVQLGAKSITIWETLLSLLL
ncbi:MAG: hypothetical protein M0P61_09230 [Ignavibacteriaceae bacterium]|jgi:hypothetical protein|nr:hypothetical protein [Ignavibacteriaceae bacterium]